MKEALPIEYKNDNTSTLIDLITNFDTDGYSPYSIEGFKEKILNKGIKVELILENYLSDLLISKNQENFNIDEMKFHSALRAWLHCDHINALGWIEEKFNFDCKDDKDFLRKYRLLNFVAVLIFENKNVDEDTARLSPIVKQERAVFGKLQDSVSRKNGSFLLNYFSEDYLKTESSERFSVMGDKLDFAPFEIAPKIFALDKKSPFVLISKNSLDYDGLYLSKPEDYAQLNLIIENIKERGFPSQEEFDSFINFFKPVEYKTKISETEAEIYRKLQLPYHREKLFLETGIPFNSLSIEEQVYFLNYLKFSNKDDLNLIKKHYKVFGIKGFKTFLSLEHGREMGDKILKLGEKLDEKDAKKIFAKYGEIVDATNEVADFVSKNLVSDNDKNQYVSEIIETLLKKGKQLLESSAVRLGVCTKEECEEIGKNIVQELSFIKKEVILTASTFKAVSKEPGVKLADLKNVSVEITNNYDILNKYRSQMEAIFLLNRVDYPKDVKQKSFEEFKEALEDSKGREFYLLKEGEDILGFLRLDFLPSGNLYAASLNIRSEIKGLAMGGAFLREILDEKARTSNIEALVYESNPMFNRYISDEYKFKIIGDIENYKDTGKKFYKLLRMRSD